MKRLLPLAAMLLLPVDIAGAQATSSGAGDRGTRGYWWYETPKADAAEKADDDAIPRPIIPPMVELAKWAPPRIAAIVGGSSAPTRANAL